jgi:hypothetical protein
MKSEVLTLSFSLKLSLPEVKAKDGTELLSLDMDIPLLSVV